MLPSLPTILQYLIMLGGVFAIIAYGYGQFSKGKVEAKFDTINLLKEQVDALEKALAFSDGKKKVEIDALNSKIDLLTKEIQELHFALDNKSKKEQELRDLISGNDMATQDFRKMVKDYTDLGRPAINTITVEMRPVIRRLDQFLNKQTF